MAKVLYKICLNCNSNFLVRESEVKRGYGKFCSRVCSSKFKVKELPNNICTNCGKVYRKRYKKVPINKFCSKECSIINLNKNKSQNIISKEGIINIIRSIKVRSGSVIYDKNPNKCKYCAKDLVFKQRKNIYCSRICFSKSKEYEIKNLSQYRNRCNFNFALNTYKGEFDFELVTRYGWYSPSNKKDNLEGVSRDHKFSVRAGYELGVSPDIISHPANCRLMKHSDNFKKKGDCSITLSRLIEDIDIWNVKYLQTVKNT